MEFNRELTKKNAEILKLLSNPMRLCLVHQLTIMESCNVSHFVHCMDVSQPNVSQNLARLKAAGIVKIEKKGNEVYYSLVNENVRKIVKLLFP